VLALLEILQSGGTRTVVDLAGRLGVDERTVRRYVAHLIDLDIPVRSVRGRYGGYLLAPGYRLPPLMLTDDEAVAVLLGLIVSRRAGLLSTAASAAESAAAKLRRVLPPPLGGRLDALLSTASFTVDSRSVAAPETGVLLLLAEAVRDRRPVALHYTSADGRRSERTVHPYGIVAHAGRWYLTGADPARDQTRTFRLDRITAAQLLVGSFDAPAGFDPTAHVLSGLARTPHQHQVTLRIHGSAEQVRQRLPPGIATVNDAADTRGWVAAQIQAERLDWIPGVLAGLGLPFVIEGPAELCALVRELGEGLVAAAGADTNRSRDTSPLVPVREVNR
jgi:predicted DNA-binding transcriptional regulator YafY